MTCKTCFVVHGGTGGSYGPDRMTSSECHLLYREQQNVSDTRTGFAVCVTLTCIMVFCAMPPREGWI